MNATRTFLITNEKFLLQPRHDYGLPFLFVFELLTRNKNDLDIIDTHTIAEMTFEFDECCIFKKMKFIQRHALTSILHIRDIFFPTTTSRNIEFGETSGLQENSFCCRLLISSPDTRPGDLHFGSFGIVKFCNH